nr:chemotaxis-specific protein-glutamate methyltransferase CheB [Verrucomicrobiota bacterium]
MADRKINVLIVEDSAVARDLLVHVLSSDPAINVIGCARDGNEAIAAVAATRPDVVTMDIHMPGIDGFETTRRIMETQPVPIVIVSTSYDPDDVAKTFQVMEAGAVAAVLKPPGPGDPRFERHARKLVSTVKSMSEVRVVKRWARSREKARAVAPPPLPRETKHAEIKIVAIGASTGGPPVLRAILSALVKPVPVPILIVQHISAGFVAGLADWLTQTTGVPLRIARDGEPALRGQGYLAPDSCQMRVERGGKIVCAGSEPENGLLPAVAPLFRSVAAVYGEQAIGVLLTGMGKDGAPELKLMRDRGAVTFAQDQESSIVYG